MPEKTRTDARVRSRRQLSLPKWACDQFHIAAGDVLELTMEGPALVLRPKKALALEALREIQEASHDQGLPRRSYWKRPAESGARSPGSGMWPKSRPAATCCGKRR